MINTIVLCTVALMGQHNTPVQVNLATINSIGGSSEENSYIYTNNQYPIFVKGSYDDVVEQIRIAALQCREPR